MREAIIIKDRHGAHSRLYILPLFNRLLWDKYINIYVNKYITFDVADRLMNILEKLRVSSMLQHRSLVRPTISRPVCLSSSLCAGTVAAIASDRTARSELIHWKLGLNS